MASLRLAASYNAGPEVTEFVRRNPIAPRRRSVSARAALERRTVQVPDVQADPEFAYAVRDVDPIRTVIAVPMVKSDALVGVIAIYRLEVRPFTDKHVELVTTFADQAVNRERAAVRRGAGAHARIVRRAGAADRDIGGAEHHIAIPRHT